MKVDGELRDLSAPLSGGESIEIVTEKSPEALELLRHDAAHVLAESVLDLWPEGEDLDRPADRRRLLLRHRVPRLRAARRRRPRPDRGADGRAREGRRALRAARAARARGDRALPRPGPGLQGRADRGPGPRRGRRDRLALPQRPLRGPLPRPPRALDRADRRLQAHLARRRLLARRRDPADAHPDLRHRLPRPQGARASTWSGSSRRGPATTAGSGPELDLFLLREEAPGMPFWLPARDGAPAADRGRGPRASSASGATSRSRRRRSSTRSSGTARGTGRTTGRTCSSSSPRSARARETSAASP